MVRSGRRCLRRHKSTTGRGALLVKQAESASRRFVSEFLVIGFALVSGCPVLADEPMVFPSPRYDYHLQECARMNLLYTGIVSRLYGEGKRDSLATAVRDWRESLKSERCDFDPLLRFALLTEMDLDRLEGYSDLYHFVRRLHYYKVNSQKARRFTARQRDSVRTWDGPFPGDAYDSLTRSIAKERLAQPDLTVEQKWLYQFYSGEIEGHFRRLNDKEFVGTKLREAYDLYGRRQEDNHEYHFVIGQSTWLPIGNLSTLGAHPSLSAGLGVIGNGFLMRFDYSLRVGAAKNLYRVRDGANLLVTDHFRMRSGSFSVGKRIWRQRKGGLFSFVGAGADRLEFRGGGSNTIGAFDASVGLWYQLFLSKYSGSFLGVKLAYNVIGFDSDGGTDLSGNAITFGIRLGSTNATYQPNRHTALRQIEFYD